MAELDELFGNEKQTTIEPYSKDDWIKQKNENRALAYEMLETATEELNNPDTVMAYLDIQSKFDRYSVSNALLVAYQNPGATRLCDSKTWQKNHVFINKGETGIIILEPGKEYTREDGKTVTPYNAKKVFDISQTNARPRQNRTKTPDARVVVKAMIANLLQISETQMSHITNVEVGHGLVKVGSALVPFERKFPKNTELYKLMTTKVGELN